MFKVLLPVDGSESALRATQKLIETLDWHKEPPHIDMVAVQPRVPQFPNMSLVISNGMLNRYYTEECEAMLAPSKKALDADGVKYVAYRLVGAIAETIVEQAKQLDSTMIFMGTRGMTALSNMVLGSVTTRVLHLAHIPVVLIH